MHRHLRSGLSAMLTGLILLATVTLPARAEGRAALDQDAKRAYSNLVASVPAAKAAAQHSVAVLVFPKITKAGLMVGGHYGEGVLLRGGKAAGYYTTSGASYGFQAGAQQYGYAMFFMHEKALKSLTQAGGFEIGVGPSVVVVDQGMGKSVSSITMQDDIYAFIFSQKGLMAGVGLQGSKITKLAP